jgi:hypothetical protein
MATLLGKDFASLALMPRSHASAFSWPSSTRKAVTKAWNEPLVGAQARRPFHLGSVKPSTVAGSSSGFTSSVL